jgi:hypothetical protein
MPWTIAITERKAAWRMVGFISGWDEQKKMVKRFGVWIIYRRKGR